MRNLIEDGEEESSSMKSVKKMLALFIIFLVVISGAFIENMNLFEGSSVMGNRVTTFGHIIQGLFLVIAYSAFSTLIDASII